MQFTHCLQDTLVLDTRETNVLWVKLSVNYNLCWASFLSQACPENQNAYNMFIYKVAKVSASDDVHAKNAQQS